MMMLRRHGRKAPRPFCFFVSFYKPHPPVLASQELYDHYAELAIPRPPSLASDTMHLSTAVIASRQVLQVSE